MVIWIVVIIFYYWVWGSWLVWVFIGVFFLQVFRLMKVILEEVFFLFIGDVFMVFYFQVCLMVVVKNEEVVIGKIVQQLCFLDYFGDCYEVWIVDDNSIDWILVILD